MVRVAFLGSDSTHANAFAKQINFADGSFFNHGRVKTIWGADAAEARRKASELNIPRVCETIEEALVDVDLAMVIGRFGESHFLPASLALARKIPTFVDKPFTVNTGEARELVSIAAANRTAFFSSSPLRFCKEISTIKAETARADFKELVVTCPKNCIELGNDPRFESPFFYGIHVVEIVLQALGHNIVNFRFDKSKNQITLFFDYPDHSASIHMVSDVLEFYHVTCYSTNRINRFEIELDGSYYTSLLQFIFSDFLTGRASIASESSVTAVSILEKIALT